MKLMAKKKIPPTAPVITVDRVSRLFRLVDLLSKAPLPRVKLTKRLRLNPRGFYRDLNILRQVGVLIEHQDGKYHLRTERSAALDLLPFPDPGLTLGEARALSRCRTPAQEKLTHLVEKIEAE